MMSPKPSCKRSNNFNCKVESLSNFLEFEEEGLHFLPCRNVDTLADLVELKNLSLYLQVVYHLGFVEVKLLVVWRWFGVFINSLLILSLDQILLQNIFIGFTDLKVRSGRVGMRKALHLPVSFVDLQNLNFSLVLQVVLRWFPALTLSIEADWKLSIIIPAVGIYHFRQQGFVADTHGVEFVIKIAFLHLWIVVGGVNILDFCCSYLWTIRLSLALLIRPHLWLR